MTVLSRVAWALGQRRGSLLRSSAPGLDADSALRSHLGWAAPAGVAVATLTAAAGAALGDRPTVLGAVVLMGALAMLPLLFRGLAIRILARLDAAFTEREALQAELDAAHGATEELLALAYHDSLTGLANRSLLHDRLGLAITHARRQASHLAVLFLDLDGFKTVNDSLGHGFGDRLLVECADRLRGSVRAGDTVARVGGDEFIVLLDSVTGAKDAARVATKVLQAVRAPFRLDGRTVSIAASSGVSVYPRDGTSPDELVRSADAAMYRDKRQTARDDLVAIMHPMAKDGEMKEVN